MKTIIRLLFMLLVHECFGQFKFFLPDKNNYFSVSTEKFFINGDTIIHAKKYKKVYVQKGDVISVFAKASYFASVREDTLNEKIFSIRRDSTNEKLLYDFKVAKGSIVKVFSYSLMKYGFQKENTVNEIDSILIGKVYRKRITFKKNPLFTPSEEWIEGIGSTKGLLYPFASDVPDLYDAPKLLCVNLNDSIIYKSVENTCYLNNFYTGFGLFQRKENDASIIFIYPNPTSAKLFIGNLVSNAFENKVKIINSSGHIVKNDFLDKDYVDVSNLLSGVYFFTIEDEMGKIIFKTKILKK